MINIKWGGVCAGVAFALALLLSLIVGQTNLAIALLRAVVFAAVFFGLGIAAWLLINSFLPDLLSSSSGTEVDIASHLFSPGTANQRVNITVDDPQKAALPGQDGSSDEVGDFNALFTPPRDIDQTSATGYTEEGETEELGLGGFSSGEALGSEGEFSSTFDDTALQEEGEGEGEDGTGGFSMDFSAFVPGGSLDGEGETDESDSDADSDSFSFFPEESVSPAALDDAPERKVSRNKPMKLEGDFDAKEIAAGLRTVLQKDKK